MIFLYRKCLFLLTSSVLVNIGHTSFAPHHTLSRRIVNGQEAPLYESYSIVNLKCYLNVTHYQQCGGTLISATHVLTSAHCLQGKIHVAVVFRAYDLNRPVEGRAFSLYSDDFKIHPNSQAPYNHSDIGLIKLPRPITETYLLGPISLATDYQNYVGSVGKIYGWGHTGDLARSPVLRVAEVRVHSFSLCEDFYPEEADLLNEDLQLCVFDKDNNQRWCKGDSGGPFVVDGIQVGIISLSSKPCTNRKPAVLMRVDAFIDWIRQYTTINS